MEYFIVSVLALLSLSILIANGVLAISKMVNVLALVLMGICAYLGFTFFDQRTATSIALMGFSIAFFIIFLFETPEAPPQHPPK